MEEKPIDRALFAVRQVALDYLKRTGRRPILTTSERACIDCGELMELGRNRRSQKRCAKCRGAHYKKYNAEYKLKHPDKAKRAIP